MPLRLFLPLGKFLTRHWWAVHLIEFSDREWRISHNDKMKLTSHFTNVWNPQSFSLLQNKCSTPEKERLTMNYSFAEKGKRAHNGLTAIMLNFHSLLSSGSVLGLVVKTLSLADALHDQDL